MKTKKKKKDNHILVDICIDSIPTFTPYTKRDKNGELYLPDDTDAPDEVKRDFEEYQNERKKGKPITIEEVRAILRGEQNDEKER